MTNVDLRGDIGPAQHVATIPEVPDQPATLPNDRTAEQLLAAVAALSPTGARLALEDLDDVADPWARAVIEAAPHVAHHLALEDRYRAVAAAAGIPDVLLEAWIHECPTMWDDRRWLRDRITAAATRRARALQLAAELEDLIGHPVTFTTRAAS